MRDESRSGKRAWARYTWKDDLESGKWSEPWSTVPDPTCMASLVRNMTIRTSSDNGKSWSGGKLLDDGPCAYSCMTVLQDGQIGILYECGDRSGIETLTFARFKLDWAER